MAIYYVYILASRRNGTIYIGVTNDIREGIGAAFTKRHRVHMLVYYETHEDVHLAIQRERTMKHWTRAWKVALIEGINPEWDDLYLKLNA